MTRVAVAVGVVLVSYVGLSAWGLWVLARAHEWREEEVEDGRVTYLDTLARLEPSDRMQRYIKRRRAKIEAETA